MGEKGHKTGSASSAPGARTIKVARPAGPTANRRDNQQNRTTRIVELRTGTRGSTLIPLGLHTGTELAAMGSALLRQRAAV
jgi:hypothetical protein